MIILCGHQRQHKLVLERRQADETHGGHRGAPNSTRRSQKRSGWMRGPSYETKRNDDNSPMSVLGLVATSLVVVGSSLFSTTLRPFRACSVTLLGFADSSASGFCPNVGCLVSTIGLVIVATGRRKDKFSVKTRSLFFWSNYHKPSLLVVSLSTSCFSSLRRPNAAWL